MLTFVRRALRILGFAALSLVALVLVAYAVIYVASARKVRRSYAVRASPIDIPGDSASIAEGKRLAAIRGCTGCHGALAQGDMFVDDWILARLVAPNLTRSVRQYSTEELVGIVRHGVPPDGKSVLGMPSGMFFALTDRDLGAIIAYLRSLPEMPGPARHVQLGPLGRLGIAIGQFVPAAAESDSMAKLSNVYPAAPDSLALGVYLARTACSECHGHDLTGDKSGRPPDLKIGGAYPLEAFVTLMRTGKPLDGRDMGLMTGVARERFSHFTDAEIRALHAYLSERWRASVSR